MEGTKPQAEYLHNKTIILSGLLLLFRCSIGGFVTIFLPIFFSEMGFSSFEIGLINTLSPLAVMCGSPVWGAIADSREGIRVCDLSFVLSSLLSFLID
jgi:MFS family permease